MRANNYVALIAGSTTVIGVVNSIFLQRQIERSRGNQLIHRRLSKTKSICSGSDPESQAVGRLWWMVFGVETGR